MIQLVEDEIAADELARLKRDAAATRIQARHRGNVVRKGHKVSLGLMILVQSCARKLIVKRQMGLMSAMIDAMVADISKEIVLEQLNVNKEEHERKMAAIRVQTRVRGMLAVRLRKRALAASTAITKRAQAKVQQARFQNARRAALMMECSWRSTLARRIAESKRSKLKCALFFQKMWRGHRVRIVQKLVTGLIVSLQIMAGENNAKEIAAIAMQRAFHAKRLRKQLKFRNRQLHAFQLARAVRTVQRAFRRMPENVCARHLRMIVTGVVLLSVKGTSEHNSARRIQQHFKLHMERRRAERLALREAAKKDKLNLLMSVALGHKDCTRAVPWSTYAKRSAHHSQVDDGGLSLHGAPPRRVRAGRKAGGLTSVVPKPPRSSHVGYSDASQGEHTRVDGASVVEELTELLPGQSDLLPNFSSRPSALNPMDLPPPPAAHSPAAHSPAAHSPAKGAGATMPFVPTVPYPPSQREAHSSTWPHPPNPTAAEVAAAEHSERTAQAHGRRLRLASPKVLSSIYTEGAAAPAAAAMEEAAEEARHGKMFAAEAANLPKLVASDSAIREDELLAMYGLSPRGYGVNKLTGGYGLPAQGPPGAAYLSARSKVEMMAAAYHKGGAPYHKGAGAAYAAGAARLPQPPGHVRLMPPTVPKPPLDERAAPPAPRRAWGTGDMGSVEQRGRRNNEGSDVLRERASIPFPREMDVREMIAAVPATALLDAQWRPGKEERDSLNYRHYRAVKRARVHQQQAYGGAESVVLPPI